MGLNINIVALGGRLTRDPEVRFTQSGLAVVNVGFAMNRRVKSGEEWREEPVFVDLTLWGKRGEAFAKFFSKGSEAFVQGELRYETWNDKRDGSKRSKLSVTVNDWSFPGGGSSTGGGGGSGRDRSSRMSAGDTPF